MLLRYLLLTFSLAACQDNTEGQPALDPDGEMIANVEAGPQTLGVAYSTIVYEDGVSVSFDTGGGSGKKQDIFYASNLPIDADPVFIGLENDFIIYLFVDAESNEANDLATTQYYKFHVAKRRLARAEVCKSELTKEQNPDLFQPDKYGTEISRSRISIQMQAMFKANEPIKGSSCQPMKSRVKGDNVF